MLDFFGFLLSRIHTRFLLSFQIVCIAIIFVFVLDLDRFVPSPFFTFRCIYVYNLLVIMIPLEIAAHKFPNISFNPERIAGSIVEKLFICGACSA